MPLKILFKKVIEWEYFHKEAFLMLYNLFRFPVRDDQMGISLSFSYVDDVICVFAHSREELRSAVLCFDNKDGVKFSDLKDFDVFEDRVFEELVYHYLSPDEKGEYPSLDEALIKALEKVVSKVRHVSHEAQASREENGKK